MKRGEGNRLADDEPHLEPASSSTPRDVRDGKDGERDEAVEVGMARTIVLRLPPFEQHREKGKPFTPGFDDEFPTRRGGNNWKNERDGNKALRSTKRLRQV